MLKSRSTSLIVRGILALAAAVITLTGCVSHGSGTGTTGTSAGTSAGPSSAAPDSYQGLSAVRHVWVIELENQGYQQTFGTPSADSYLARTLPRMGALLENYYGIGHASADNYIAEVSGQAPSLGTQADCPVWIPFADDAVAGPYHQAIGEGCVYPAHAQTVGNQLSGAGRSWAVYLQDMGNDPARDKTVSTARGPPAGIRRPGLSTTLSGPRKVMRTPPAMMGSHSSPRSPGTRRSVPRTYCRSGRCQATWPAPVPPRRSRLSYRTCAMTAMTHRAPAAPQAVWPRPTRSWRSGCRRSWPRRPTGPVA